GLLLRLQLSSSCLPSPTMKTLVKVGLLFAALLARGCKKRCREDKCVGDGIETSQSGPVAEQSTALVFLLGAGLNCETCISPGEGCTGLAHTCASSEDTCLTIVGTNSLGGSDTTETLKTCIAAADCYAGSISITTDATVHLQSISSCCQDDLCNRRELSLPPVNLTSNGLQCPVCFAFGADHCDGIETLGCAGADSHCISVAGMMSTGGGPSRFTARGCSTGTACSLPLGIGLYSAGTVFNLSRVTCSPQPKASRGREKPTEGRKP
ncbi:hypothetical protein lerEdw1_015113, partial [Lerista edwardsae]